MSIMIFSLPTRLNSVPKRAGSTSLRFPLIPAAKIPSVIVREPNNFSTPSTSLPGSPGAGSTFNIVPSGFSSMSDEISISSGVDLAIMQILFY